jgi:translation initiation factor 4E
MSRQKGQNAGNPTNYSAANKKIASFSSVEDFWAIYSHLVRSSDLSPTTQYSLFRHPITPTWEHPSHLKGGKWSAHLKKNVSSRLWEQLLLALIGDAFSEIGEDEVTGITLNVKHGEDVLSIWNRHGTDGRKNLAIKRVLKEVLGVAVNWEYAIFEEIKEKNTNGNAASGNGPADKIEKSYH